MSTIDNHWLSPTRAEQVASGLRMPKPLQALTFAILRRRFMRG